MSQSIQNMILKSGWRFFNVLSILFLALPMNLVASWYFTDGIIIDALVIILPFVGAGWFWSEVSASLEIIESAAKVEVKKGRDPNEAKKDLVGYVGRNLKEDLVYGLLYSLLAFISMWKLRSLLF